MVVTCLGRLLVVALLGISVSGCDTEAKPNPEVLEIIPSVPDATKTLPLMLEAKSGALTMKLGTLTVQFPELSLEKSQSKVFFSKQVLVSHSAETWSTKGTYEQDGVVSCNWQNEVNSGSSGTFTFRFEKPVQKEIVFELIDEGEHVRYAGTTYSLKDSPTLVIDGDGVRANSTE